MRRVISSSEVVGTCEWRGNLVDISAHSDAFYDEESATMTVKLTVEAEPADIAFHPRWEKPDWLPAGQAVTEHLPYEEALPAAKNIFRSWSRKVRESMPARAETTQKE